LEIKREMGGKKRVKNAGILYVLRLREIKKSIDKKS